MEQQIEYSYPEYGVVLAENGFVALDRVKRQPFDLVVTDYQMPGMTGIDLTANIRRLSPQTLIVLMSGNLLEAEARSKSQKLHLDGYLEKPIIWDKFWTLVSE